ncbi:MAG: hypothetical protein IKA99_06630 [Clostridia bacterium]|nr:hypothetical protein [Clostridia bacterium]
MAENITNKLVQRISVNHTDEEIKSQLHTVLDELETIYSYLIYAKYKAEKLVCWQIEYTISQTDKYNTLHSCIVVEEIFAILKESNEKKVSNVIGYKQPSLDIQIQLFEPLINKLALKQIQRWPQIEYEDACQICRMTMLNLYRKGYYLHPTLVERCYNNDILSSIKKDKNKPEIISIDKVVHHDGDNTPLTIGDMLPDTQAEEDAEQKDAEEFIQLVFGQVKEIIIELIGERQFEQLMRDYGNKHTTSWSRKKMQQLKDKFKQMDINWESFNRYK